MKTVTDKKFIGKTFADICCGIGGFRIAMESLGATCVFSSEIEKNAIKTYAKNFGEIPSGDITKIETEEIPDHDILIAGFPCQPFSIAGTKKGFEDRTRGTIFFDLMKIIKVKKPQVIVLENVINLLVHDNGNTFSVIRKSIKSAGYDFYYRSMNAADYGIPQNRKRLFIVAFRKDLRIKNFEFPDPFELTHYVEDVLENEADIPGDMYIDRTDLNITKTTSDYKNKPVQVGHIAKNRQGERVYSPKGTAITLTSNGGGKFGQTGGYLINGKMRKLTPRECARLMGFPEYYILPESNNQAYRLLGNSVVVDVVQYLVEAIGEALNNSSK